MSETMVERVAKVLHELPGDGYEWATASEEQRQHARVYARAAIEAMREPTDAMKAAWDKDFTAWLDHQIQDDDHLYKVMIDAALSEKPQ